MQTKTCDREKKNARSREYYKENKEKVLLRIKQYRVANKEKITKRMKQYHKDNVEKEALRHKKYYKNNTKKVNDINKENYKRNKKQILLKHKEWRAANPKYHKSYYKNNREEILIKQKQWRIDNPAKIKANNARHRAIKLQAVPPWANKIVIDMIYKHATELNEQGNCYEVHHIYPLLEQKDKFCGLHTEANLIILDKEQHKRWHKDKIYIEVKY